MFFLTCSSDTIQTFIRFRKKFHFVRWVITKIEKESCLFVSVTAFAILQRDDVRDDVSLIRQNRDIWKIFSIQ